MLGGACIPPTGDPLVGRVVRLDVMRPEDVEGLFAVYSDPVVYTQGYAMALPPASPAVLQPLVTTAIDARQPDGTGRTAYTIRLVEDSPLGAAGTIVGTSSLGDVDTKREHVHLGWTMYASRWWGSTVNPESKFLLLAHAFETCGFGRVKLQTDVINEPVTRRHSSSGPASRASPDVTSGVPMAPGATRRSTRSSSTNGRRFGRSPFPPVLRDQAGPTCELHRVPARLAASVTRAESSGLSGTLNET